MTDAPLPPPHSDPPHPTPVTPDTANAPGAPSEMVDPSGSTPPPAPGAPDIPSTPDPLPYDPERIADLAQGFAHGSLTDPELQELYGMLRFRTEEAGRVAREVWDALSLTLDIRASVGHTFQDTISHRVRGDEPSHAFSDSVLDRLGAKRPQLEPLAIPEVRRWGWDTLYLFLSVFLVGMLLGGGLLLLILLS